MNKYAWYESYMMNLENKLKLVLQKLAERYGDDLPNPDHQPQVFQYLVKLYLYDLENEQRTDTV